MVEHKCILWSRQDPPHIHARWQLANIHTSFVYEVNRMLLSSLPKGKAMPLFERRVLEAWIYECNTMHYRSLSEIVVLCYIVYGSYVRYSLYNNVRCIRVVMCVNAMWMCHHWFMHIETHPCLDRSHTRASTIVIMVIIRNAFDEHMT